MWTRKLETVVVILKVKDLIHLTCVVFRIRGRVETRPGARTDIRHDPLTYIGPDRQATLPPSNLPIPVGIFMNMALSLIHI